MSNNPTPEEIRSLKSTAMAFPVVVAFLFAGLIVCAVVAAIYSYNESIQRKRAEKAEALYAACQKACAARERNYVEANTVCKRVISLIPHLDQAVKKIEAPPYPDYVQVLDRYIVDMSNALDRLNREKGTTHVLELEPKGLKATIGEITISRTMSENGR